MVVSSAARSSPDFSENTFFGTLEVEELSVPGWRLIFAKVGYPDGLSARTLTHAQIATALVGRRLDAQLMDALQVNADLGTEEGRTAIFEAAEDVAIDTKEWPKEETARELAARLWAEHESNADFRRVLDRALMAVSGATDASRRFRQFGGKEARPIRELDRGVKALQRELLVWCQDTGRGDYAEVRKCEVSGSVFFELLHGHRMTDKVVVEKRRRAVIKLRPLHADTVRYDPATGRLGIAARRGPATQFYREVFGRVLFRDGEFFQGGRMCTLKPLMERGRSVLERREVDPRILRVRLIDCLWRPGQDNGDLVRFSGQDCFQRIEAMKVSLCEGALLEATIEVHIDPGRDGRRSRKKEIVIKPPDRVDYCRDRDEQLIEELLRVVGITSRGTVLEGREGFWALHPWTHEERRWRRSFGAEVDRMFEQGLLEPVARSRAEHPDHPESRSALRAAPLPDGDTYGVSEDGDVPSRTLSPCDVAGLRLNVAQLAGAVAKDLALQGSPRDLDGDESVWNLGSRAFGSAQIRVFFLARKPADPASLGKRLSSISGSAKPVVIVPEGEARTGLTEVELGAPSGPLDRLLRPIIEMAKLHADVPVIEYSLPGTQLVIDRHHGLIWFEGVPVDLKPDHQAFLFLAALAEGRGAAVSREQLLDAVGSEADDPEVAVRKLKKHARDTIKRCLVAAGRSVPAELATMIQTRKEGFVLAVRHDLA